MMETHTTRELDYGNDNVVDAMPLMRPRNDQGEQDAWRGKAVPSISSKATKNRLLAFGLFLCGAGAVLAYCSGTTNFALSETTPDALSSMNLASDENTTGPGGTLESGRAFLLKSLTKTNLCVDDGGDTWAGQAKSTMQPCDRSSVNQGFVFDNTTFQIKSKMRHNMCIEIAHRNALVFRRCHSMNPRQKFAYDASAQTFNYTTGMSSPQCFYDGGIDEAGAQFTMKTCNTTDMDQKFEIKYQDEPFSEQPAISDAIARGDRFMIRIPTRRSRCFTVNRDRIRTDSCNQDNKDQYFQRNATTNQIYLYQESSRCLVADLERHMEFVLRSCNSSDPNQSIDYDQGTMQIHSGQGCLESTFADTHVRLTQRTCNTLSPNQLFERVLAPPLPNYDVPSELQQDKPIQFALARTSLCVTWRPGVQQGLYAQPCDSSNATMFLYNSTNYLLSNQASNGSCVKFAGRDPEFDSCVADDRGKIVLYNNATQQIRNPITDRCMSFIARWVLFEPCSTRDRNQRFEIRVK